MSEISEEVKAIIKKTAKKLTGSQRREFIAEITNELFGGSARKAEREFGWGRETVHKGIRELATGIECLDNYSARGKKKTEEKIPQLIADIQSLFDKDGQLLPDFKADFPLGKITARAVRRLLVKRFGYRDDQLPSENTIGNILTRLGYRPASLGGTPSPREAAAPPGAKKAAAVKGREENLLRLVGKAQRGETF
ncbi:MAG: hypothetical protein PVI39_08015 [Desulfobacteraceae bacterium]